MVRLVETVYGDSLFVREAVDRHSADECRQPATCEMVAPLDCVKALGAELLLR